MGFVDAIKTCFTKYATFRGRASRSEFWWFVLFNVVANVVLNLIYEPLAGIFGLVTLLPYMAVGCRRLHDINLSGWLMLLPLAGGPFMVLSWWMGSESLGLFGAVVSVLLTILVVVWNCKRGDAEDNRFGPPPLVLAPDLQSA